ncbi:MAG: DNA replication and repair protein RecF [Candidatus Krumholzibacteria bacterium]|nr:DNA replication and repair protein RecF [Candidatus Krumholzibacteria bacterium]
MIIRGVDITNFRNIARATIAFSPSFNLIEGRNAQGKTNLLEAIYLFCLGRSFRTRSLDEAVRFGEEYFFVKIAGTSDSGVDFEMEAAYEREGRARVSINGKRAAGFADAVGVIPGVIFVPEDILLASGPPAGRRAYLDYTAAQISLMFLRDIKEYRLVLRQRNALLERAARDCAQPEGIEAWDEAVAAKGAAIVRMRLETIGEIARRAEKFFGEIVGEPGGFRMEYACSFSPTLKEPETELREALARAREAERRRGYTMAGPHYDDVRIFLEGAELRRYGSQGRKRLAALVLKLAQALAILERRGERPVVMLDDIFSELDRDTAARVREHLTGGYQSFITTPRANEPGVPGDAAARFAIEAGSVSPIA